MFVQRGSSSCVKRDSLHHCRSGGIAPSRELLSIGSRTGSGNQCAPTIRDRHRGRGYGCRPAKAHQSHRARSHSRRTNSSGWCAGGRSKRRTRSETSRRNARAISDTYRHHHSCRGSRQLTRLTAARRRSTHCASAGRLSLTIALCGSRPSRSSVVVNNAGEGRIAR